MQDVKNIYFKEKNEFDNKFQNIQNKNEKLQQNTVTNGFFESKTSGFFVAGGGNQRPFTQNNQARIALQSQPLIQDDHVLKGDLEQITKDDMRERLLVAEMVMKKLF